LATGLGGCGATIIQSNTSTQVLEEKREKKIQTHVQKPKIEKYIDIQAP